MAIAECAGGCPPAGTVYDPLGLVGGGFAYPLRKGRWWIAGDVNARISDGYFDASGGPTALVGLGSFKNHRLDPFVQGGPRWGDGGNTRWNVGAGAQLWASARVGLRVEYQYQWQQTTLIDQAFGPAGPVGPPTRSPLTIDEHLFRAGIAIR